MTQIRKFALTAGAVAGVVLGSFMLSWYLYLPRSQFSSLGCNWIKDCSYITAAIGEVARCQALPFRDEILYLGGNTNYAEIEFRAEGALGVALTRLRLERNEKRWFVKTASFRGEKGENLAEVHLNSECQTHADSPNR